MNASFTRISRLGSMLLAAALLTSCGSGPPPRLYLLEPQALEKNLEEPAKEQERSTPRLSSLGVATINLPGYASSAQIASLAVNGTVTQEDGHRWAEEPAVAISRLLVNRLRERAETTVLSEPWPRDFQPAARVKVVFDRLLREPLGGADMAGQILLLSGDGRTLLKTVPFEFVLYGRDTARRVFFVAVSQGVDDIARLAIEALLGMKLKS